MMQLKSKNIFINQEDKIIKALSLMDEERVSLLVVLENNRFVSVLSMGDIQRVIIKLGTTDVLVKESLREDIVVAENEQSLDKIKLLMAKHHTEFMPVLSSGSLEKIIFWEDVFERPFSSLKPLRGVSVVIMAGGKGTRLKPLTNIIPKPMVPVGSKTIMEYIIAQFESEGCMQYFATVNYKSAMLKFYFSSIEKSYTLNFIDEDTPLGTGGSLAFLKNKITSTFFVSNCDILLEQSMSTIYDYHKAYANDITIVSSIIQNTIPYGTLETSRGGLLKSMQEKPTNVFQINTGVYVMEPSVFEHIEDDKFQHITDIILRIKTEGGRVGVFPVSEKSWFDIGQWDEYQKSLKEFRNRF